MSATVAHEPATIHPGLRGLEAFCELIGEALEPFERRIARAHFGAEREVVAVLPRGNKKTTLAAKIALHHLLTVPGAAVTIGAASRDQARICFERMRGFAGHEALDDQLVIRHLELRHEDEHGHLRLLRVVPAEGARVHGLSSSLYIGDEVWAWSGDDLLEAMLTGLVKDPQARFLGISTAAARLDSPLGRLRSRALAGHVTRKGAVTDATAPGLRWLEWSLAEDRDLDDYRAVKAANPAAYITTASLREQAKRVTPLSFAQFHACRWGAGEGAWLPPGAWQACIGEPQFEDGQPIWIGVDVGGDRSASAVVWINADLHVGAAIYHGDSGVLECVDQVRDLAAQYNVREVVFDPWRFGQAAQELERERVTVLAFPQTDVRMVPASIRLHAAIVEQRLTLPNNPELTSHAAHAIARHSRRGWRLDKAGRTDSIDAVIALCMALERAEFKPEPVTLLGWV